MPYQEEFAVERFMDDYETKVKYNLAETCCYSLSINEVAQLAGPKSADQLMNDILNQRLTYGNITGSPELKKEISNLYNNCVEQDNIIISNGAIGANFLVYYGIVNAKDHVIVMDPHYSSLSSVPKMFGAEIDLFKVFMEDNYQPKLDELEKLIKPNTKLLIINNPNNPTGAVWNNNTLGAIVEICEKNDIIIHCDEVYRPLFHNDDYPKSIVEFGYKRTISTSSMSKAFALAGLRLGWIATLDNEMAKTFCSRRDYNTISVSGIDDKLATFALQNKDVILQRNSQLCRKNLDIIDKLIKESNGLLEWIRPEGGSTTFIKVKHNDSEKLCRDLAETYKVLLIPGSAFGYNNYIRLGFGNSTDELIKGLPILIDYLEKHQ